MSRPRRVAVALAAAALGTAAAGCGGGEPSAERRVIVFGVDGLDPEMLQERVAAGAMPHFARLLEDSALHPLQTSWPPQSPVAWSNFITGANPGRHGLYDFIHVDREDYGVQSSMSETEDVGLEMPLFGYRLPLTGGDMELTRRVPAFWEVLSEEGVPCYVHRMPANFPLAPTEAITFPDMGTPDLTGAASGVAYLWTEEGSAGSGESYRRLPVDVNRRNPDLWKAYSRVYGPEDTARDVGDLVARRDAALEAGDVARANELDARIGKARETITPLAFHVDRTGPAPRLAVDTGAGWATAEEGGWSNWVPVEFGLMWGDVVTVSGWTRFLFKSAQPFEVYGTPVQIDPWNPAMPVSTPESASAGLADAIGPYMTQGFPDAYKAYKEGLLDTGEFVRQSDEVLEERGRMMDYALGQLDASGGLLFFYVGSLDMRCHMLWHCMDRQHPHQEGPGSVAGVPYEAQIDRIYRQVDGMLGRLMERVEAMEAAGEEVELLVMSDHGFAPMHRVMHVNDWLVHEGYLVLRDGAGTTGPLGLALERDSSNEPRPGTGSVDWSRTRAYAVGFNGIILNREGREPHGIVAGGEAAPLLDEIRAKLLAMEDDAGGGSRPVFRRVLPARAEDAAAMAGLDRDDAVFAGGAVDRAPDLQLGFATGFGASDPTAVGAVTGSWREGEWIVDNDSRWSGSHLMDPEVVRGTLIVRGRQGVSGDPALEDITATLYGLFGVAPPEGTDGRDLFRN